jgi:3-phenylpropionate/trans-cinnamate dioxygenase ferredoxin subunit
VKLGFVKVGETSEIPAGKMKKVTINGEEILVANVNGKYYAIGNRCTHHEGDLSQGSLEGNTVTCPKRRAKFDVTTGKVVLSPKLLFFNLKIKDEPFYQAKVEGKDVLVKTE